MPTEVVMPQMGESIAEGTIVRWIKKVGDKVDRDEPLFEISTDKVDAEIPSPTAGVITEIRVNEGETVPIHSVVAVIGQADGAPVATPQHEPLKPTAPAPQPLQATSPEPTGPTNMTEETIRRRSSPLVRKIATEHNVDISRIHGTGIAGRVTKQDIVGFLASREATGTRPSLAAALPVIGTGAPGEVQPMSVMRKKIAEHMIASHRTSAHVHSLFEVNFSRITQVRDAMKAEYERAGAKLTYLSFIVKAVTDALRRVPVVNASIHGDNVVYHRDFNIGIAVALDWGLIVPVIKKAGEQNLLGLNRAVADLANRARSKQLKPDEVAGGTFTITNPGIFGALFGMPIINQPQVAILGVGHVEKRPVVIDDAIAIRPMAYLTLGYDHRLIDGAIADQFMSQVKHALENWDPSAA